MKVKFIIVSLFSLVSGGIARSTRFRARANSDPVPEHQRVTAFINTDEGLQIECWEIGDYLPTKNNAESSMRATSLAGNIAITLFSFAPSVTLFSFDHPDGPQANAVDFRAQPNLFTVKDGLVIVNATPEPSSRLTSGSDDEIHVFADLNGDDWFYFEDQTEEPDEVQCVKPRSKKEKKSSSTFTARTISGSDTTLINFAYQSTPKHRVLHKGRCNFAGLVPIESEKFRVQ